MSETGKKPTLRGLPRDSKLVIGLVSGAEFINHMYLVLIPPIIGLLASDFNTTLAVLGLAMGAQGVTNVGLQLPFGYLSDNYDRMIPLGLSLGIGTLGVFIVAVAPSIPVLILGQLVIGAGVAGHHPVHFPLLAEATPEELRGRAFSFRGFTGNIGFAAVPALMTVLIGFRGISWRPAVAVIGVIGAVYSAVTLLSFHRYVDPGVTAVEKSSTPQKDRKPIKERIIREVRSIGRAPDILSLSLLALASAIVAWGLNTFTVVLLTDGYGIGFDLANLSLSGMFLVGAVMMLVGGYLTDRLSPGPIIVGTFVLMAVLIVLVGSTAIPWVAAIVLAIFVGGVRSVASPARSKLTDFVSARGDLGRNFALITIGTMVGSAVAPPLFGTMIDSVGIATAFMAISGFAVFAAILTVVILVALR